MDLPNTGITGYFRVSMLCISFDDFGREPEILITVSLGTLEYFIL